MTAAGTSLRRSAMTQKTPEARRPAQRRAEERPAGPARRGPGPGLSPPAAPGSAAKPAFFSPTAAGRQLAPFRRACPFFCHDDTRQMERIHSGLQVQGVLDNLTEITSICAKSNRGQRRDVDKTGQIGVASVCFPGFPRKRWQPCN
ncbi:uncharacterized protein LOC115343022 isoform X4 [Aquila chrysaetos chrysaetos]|uniref:uncharacterized protein LOC115343022 isoform X4 n=1 Tax=Aquila chrysaetos chrysaetos TaxID=223781 RepID=UPI001176C70C|nr:uncharacterized protein LOC115343022 isoform X4 [Aquila chrysaetos chrysaetos]